ncbi:MAG: hypothetical protein P4N60_22985 [Verrucomicrobiae bacterium]|nr:hypothetical protein [Verrucomicrobiae bacterium]
MPRPSTDADAFKIKATRIKAADSDDGEFFWFYISLHLEKDGVSQTAWEDIVLVEYHLLDTSFPEPNVRIRKGPANGFEYRFWLYGFIKVSADLVTRQGEIIKLPATPISWPVTQEEIAKNGKRELSW